jgi:hypothetical protein
VSDPSSSRFRTAPAAPAAPAAPEVSLHLFTVTTRRVPRALWHMAVDRLTLRSTSGLRFFKLLGTGDGTTFDVRDADPHTWGLLTVWDDEAARRAFATSSSVLRAWHALSAEQWRADLVLMSKGSWSGADPFRPSVASGSASRGSLRPDGPVAAITRARLRPRLATTFWRAVPPVTAELRRAPGLLLSLGIGEAPIGLQGTFSAWRDAGALREFAYVTAAHRRAIADTSRTGWYAEDLFARFAVERSTGTLWGGDPLA